MKERVEGRQNSFSLFSFVSCRETSTGREAGAFPRKDNCHISLLAYSLALEENINYYGQIFCDSYSRDQLASKLLLWLLSGKDSVFVRSQILCDVLKSFKIYND